MGFYINGQYIASLSKSIVDPVVAQAMGDSEVHVMSQKAVTDAIGMIYTADSYNKFNKDSAENVDGIMLNNYGEPIALTGYGYSHKIPAADGKTYYVMGIGDVGNAYVATFYGEDDGFIASAQRLGIIETTAEGYKKFTIPEGLGVSYMRVSFSNKRKDEYLIAQTETAPTEYKPFTGSAVVINKDFMQEIVATVLEEVIDTIAPDIVQEMGDSETAIMSQKAVADAIKVIYTTKSSNLFNKDSEENVDGYLINGGKEIAISGYGYSHPIAVNAGKTYFVKVSGDVGHMYVATFFNEGNTPVAQTQKSANVGNVNVEQVDDYWYFTVPEGKEITYVRCSYRNTKIDEFMVVQTDTKPTEYIPFTAASRLVLSKFIADHIAEEIAKNAPSSNDQHNPLRGKKLAVNGDSICYGAGSTGGYAAFIGANNNMTVQNIGVSGGTITAEVYKEGGSARHWISRTIENMDADADYAIVEGGVNDSSLAVPLGSITADYGDTLDDTTFYGAFESMLKQLLTRFAGKKVGYIAVHQMSANFRASNAKETSYYWAAKICCEKWGVPFLDLNTTVPPFGLIRNVKGQAELYAATRAVYTHDADGWHPNEEGYKKYYVPKIEAWLKTL